MAWREGNGDLATTLQPKGREIALAGVAQQMTPGGAYFLFGFSKEFLDFGKKRSRSAVFHAPGKALVKAKFDPSEMLYHGNPAL